MKTIPIQIQFTRRLRLLRIVAAGILFTAAAALATTAIMRIRLPWAAPVVRVGVNTNGVVVEPATNTIYVANVLGNTVSVIDGNQCNASNPANCKPIATMTNVRLGPIALVIDDASQTLYVTNGFAKNGDGRKVALMNIAACNAQDTSGETASTSSAARSRSINKSTLSLSRSPVMRTLS